MNNKDTSYRIPEGFNPFSAIDTVRALTDAIHHLATEGELIERPAPQHALGTLQSLLELLQREAHELHAYLREIENSTTLALPGSDADFEALHVNHARNNKIRETAAIYSIR